MEIEPMDLQKLTFFTEGNTFTGSRTKGGRLGPVLRYLVHPDKETGRLLAYSWTSDVCFEKAEERKNAEFPLSDEGLEEIQVWLQERFSEL